MSQRNPRKRPAPGSSPMTQQTTPLAQQGYNPIQQSSPQLTDDQFLNWGNTNTLGNLNGAPVADPNFNPALYGTLGNGITGLPGSSLRNNIQPPAAPSPPNTGQLTRRPNNQHLVSRGPRPNFSASNEWPVDFDTDGTGMELQAGPAGAWLSSEQELEQRALVAKRDAQAKRKQIPPFVQKLNR
jgi:heat shock transcription factor, other eukaryote